MMKHHPKVYRWIPSLVISKADACYIAKPAHSFESEQQTKNRALPLDRSLSLLLCSLESRSQDAKIGTETPAADGDAARKRPSAGDAPAPAPADKRHRPDPPSSGSHDRHRHRHSHGHGHSHSRPSTAGGGEKKLRASHILIKHEGSRRKASWRDPQGVAISATTRDDAADLARALREKIVAGERKFEDVATEESDCNSAKRGGDLGSFERGKMQKAFEKAVVALKVGEISDVVDTDSGVHIILRTA